MASETYKDPALPKAGVDYGELRRNAMGLPSAFAMSVAFISPTIGNLSTTTLSTYGEMLTHAEIGCQVT
jgi:hypothetical protein